MIYVISKATFGSYNVRDIQCNANWDCCPYSDYALIPDSMVEGILATKGYCDITLNSAGTEVASFTARTIPSVPEECCGTNTVLSVNGVKANTEGELTLTAAQVGALPTTGGEVTGDLAVHKIDILPKTSAYTPGLKILDSDGNSRAGIYSGSDHKMYLSNFSKGTDKAERFYLPAPESELTDTASYDILTTKKHGIDLLWTNASPTSNFPAQTLSLGLNKYSMYIVLARHSTDISSLVCAIGKTGIGVRLSTIGALDTGYYEVRRTVSYETGGALKFYEVYRNGIVNSEGHLVPQFIYGVKGVRQL